MPGGCAWTCSPPPHPDERLDGVGALCAWIRGAGLVPGGTALEHADGSWLAGFRELRGHVGVLVRGGARRRPGGRSGG